MSVDNRDYHLTQALAGARRLDERYDSADMAQRTIINMAVDAWRIGLRSLFTADLLRDAARGYLTGVHPGDGWFEAALEELTSYERWEDRGTAPLITEASPGRRKVSGYRVSDHLLQRLVPVRRAEPSPAPTWDVPAGHVYEPQDVLRLAENAERRLLLRQAGHLYGSIASVDVAAERQLGRLLLEPGRTAEAIPVLRRRADAGDEPATHHLVEAPAQLGRLDDLMTEVRAGPRRRHGVG